MFELMCIVSGLFVGLILIFRNNKALRITTIDILIIALIVWGITGIFFRDFNYADTFFSVYTLFLWTLPYLYFRNVFTRNQKFLTGTIVIYLAVVSCQAAYGLLQLYGFYSSNHNLFQITGSFHNPGPFAGFLVSGIPMALGLYFFSREKQRNNNCKIVVKNSLKQKLPGFRTDTQNKPSSFSLKLIVNYYSQFVLALLLISLSATQSRAAWIGAFISCIYILWAFRKKMRVQLSQIQKKIIGATVSILLVFALLSLYKFKQASADGRVLMWQVSWEMIKDKPLFGWGEGGFDANYSNYQAEWFRSGKGTPAQEMVAGTPDAPFNEIIRIGISHGLVGVVLFFAVCMLLFRKNRTAYSNRKSDFSSSNVVLLKGALLSILCFSLFSYTFDISPMVLQLIILLALIVSMHKEQGRLMLVRTTDRFRMMLLRFVGILLLTLLPVLSSVNLQRYQAYKYWKEAYQLYQFQIYSDAAEAYRKAVELLPNNGLLLQMYGKCLLMNKEYQESKSILEKAKRYYSNTILYAALGDLYKAQEQYNKAEHAYLHAWYMVPHRFYPKYLLAKLYRDSGQKEKALQVVNELLEKEIKVESQAIEEMRNKLKRFFK